MPQPNPVPDPEQKPLPLFRAEAIAAQQQKYYGEILLIRPLPLSLFFWLAMGISALVLGFLLLGSYTERVHAAGVLLPLEGANGKAEVYVPEAEMKFVRVGETVPFRCESCSGPQRKTATVSGISQSALSREGGPAYAVTLTVPREDGELPYRTRIEADLPGGRKPLLKWLFER